MLFVAVESPMLDLCSSTWSSATIYIYVYIPGPVPQDKLPNIPPDLSAPVWVILCLKVIGIATKSSLHINMSQVLLDK